MDLEERDRLLHEKVRAQRSTIEEQAARIDQLEQALEAARAEPTVGAHPDDPQDEYRRPWARLSAWLGDS